MLQEDLLHEAASRGDAEVLQALLEAAGDSCLSRTDGRGLGRTPLHAAIMHGQAATAELLIEAQLRHAATRDGVAGSDGAAEVAQAAAVFGLDATDSQGFTALHWAATKGSTSVLRRLLAAGADREASAADQMRPLHLAAKAGHAAAVHALLEAGCCVTGERRSGWHEGLWRARGKKLEVQEGSRRDACVRLFAPTI